MHTLAAAAAAAAEPVMLVNVINVPAVCLSFKLARELDHCLVGQPYEASSGIVCGWEE